MLTNSLTINDLKLIANHFSFKLKSKKKNDIIKELENSNIDKKSLLLYAEQILQKKKGKTTKKTSRKSSSSKKNVESSFITTMTNRIDAIENQIKFIMNSLALIDEKMSFINFDKTRDNHQSDREKNTSQKELIRHHLLLMISQGNSKTIDEIIQNPLISPYSFSIIEEILLEMIDEEIFDGSEGKSHLKINESIARIIRR